MFFSIFSINRVADRFNTSYIATVNAENASSALRISLGTNYQKKYSDYHSWGNDEEKFFISEKQMLSSYENEPLITTHIGWLVKNITPDVNENLENIKNKIFKIFN